MPRTVLDKPVRKIWNLNQLKIGETVEGIPTAEYWENKKGNKFIKLGLDYGYATCYIYFLIFEYPEQKLLNKKLHNSYELVRFYRECNFIPVDEGISQLHDINWQDIIDWLNKGEMMRLKVISTNMNGFKNIQFLKYKVDEWVHFSSLKEVDEYLND